MSGHAAAVQERADEAPQTLDRRIDIHDIPLWAGEKTGHEGIPTGLGARTPRVRPITDSGWVARYRRRAAIIDTTVAVLVGWLCLWTSAEAQSSVGFLALMLAAPIVWVAANVTSHSYAIRFIGVGTEEYRAVMRAAVRTLATIAVFALASKTDFGRSFVFAFVPGVLVLSLLGRAVLRFNLFRRRTEGHDMQATLVVGRADSVRALIREIKRDKSSGLHIVGACVSGLDTPGVSQTEIEGVPVLGPPENALTVIDRIGVQTVAISSHPDLVGHSMRRLGWALEERHVDLLIDPGIVGVAGPRLSLRPASGMSLLRVERPVTSGLVIGLKTVFDRLVATGIVLVASPLLLAIAVAIKLDSKGAVFFRQTRIGTGGEPFQVIKFRSMVQDAEAKKSSLSSDRGNDTLFKIKGDPRITRVGNIIRKYSLDELPQLFNVIRGEMSLIGPRPNLPSEVATYEDDAFRRLRVRPGMTGLWQVSGRSNLSWSDALRLDLWYVDNWSFGLDLVILVRTVRAVVSGSGAY